MNRFLQLGLSSSLTLWISILFSFQAPAALQAGEPNGFDAEGKKHGYWVVKGNMSDKPGYSPEATVEEGEYLSGKRKGQWKRYFPNGKLKNEITYVNDKAYGPYREYYENGNLQEEAHWVPTVGKQVGDFKRFHPNGQLHQEYRMNADGNRDGVQKVYHENGQLAVLFSVSNGKEEGLVQHFDENGKLIKQREMANGVMKPGSMKEFGETFSKPEIPVEDPDLKPTTTTATTNDSQLFRPNGYNVLYNDSNQKERKGDFKNGGLINGEVYKYNKHGLLKKVEVWRNGKYVGNRQLTEDEKS